VFRRYDEKYVGTMLGGRLGMFWMLVEGMFGCCLDATSTVDGPHQVRRRMGAVRVTYVSEKPEPHPYNKTLVDFMDAAEELTMNELRENQGDEDNVSEHVERPAFQFPAQGPGQ